jgi:Ca2+-transporting ATPase
MLDDSFASIVGGVRLGRRIFANLRRALIYITAIHVPIAGLALLPILFGLPPLLYPMHVVLLELAIDPTCALVFESEPSEGAAMRRPPRRRNEALFGASQLALAAGQGLVVLCGVLGLYVWALQDASEAQARGAAFIALVLSNLALALSDVMSTEGRVLAPRPAYWLIAGSLIALMVVVFAAPYLAGLFAVAPPPVRLLIGAIAVAAASGAWHFVYRALRKPSSASAL